MIEIKPAKDVSPSTIESIMTAMSGLVHFMERTGLKRPLIELVTTRASQISGCAYCLNMHTKDARARGRASSAFTC